MYGDFVGLDDLFTEQPEVRDGLIDIYKSWADSSASTGSGSTPSSMSTSSSGRSSRRRCEQAAAQAGKEKFFMFGEVYDANAANMSRYTTEGKLQATLDFGFQAAATNFGKGSATTGSARPVRQ